MPCRWAKSGWKYVQADPSKTKYFNSPNRVNSFGHHNVAEHLKRMRLNNSVERSNDFRPRDSGF